MKRLGMRAWDVTECIYTTASFWLKIKIETARRNRIFIKTAVSSHRHLGFSKEEKNEVWRSECGVLV